MKNNRNRTDGTVTDKRQRSRQNRVPNRKRSMKGPARIADLKRKQWGRSGNKVNKQGREQNWKQKD